MGVTLVLLFVTLAALCALLAVTALTEMLAPARVATSTDLSGAAIGMLSDAAREEQTRPHARSLDAVLRMAKHTALVRRVAAVCFMSFLLPLLW